jgi:hypothetical protein
MDGSIKQGAGGVGGRIKKTRTSPSGSEVSYPDTDPADEAELRFDGHYVSAD